jgi:thioredoxin reductase/2'-5' RNA ligase
MEAAGVLTVDAPDYDAVAEDPSIAAPPRPVDRIDELAERLLNSGLEPDAVERILNLVRATMLDASPASSLGETLIEATDGVMAVVEGKMKLGALERVSSYSRTTKTGKRERVGSYTRHERPSKPKLASVAKLQAKGAPTQAPTRRQRFPGKKGSKRRMTSPERDAALRAEARTVPTEERQRVVPRESLPFSKAQYRSFERLQKVDPDAKIVNTTPFTVEWTARGERRRDVFGRDGKAVRSEPVPEPQQAEPELPFASLPEPGEFDPIVPGDGKPSSEIANLEPGDDVQWTTIPADPEYADLSPTELMGEVLSADDPAAAQAAYDEAVRRDLMDVARHMRSEREGLRPPQGIRHLGTVISHPTDHSVHVYDAATGDHFEVGHSRVSKYYRSHLDAHDKVQVLLAAWQAAREREREKHYRKFAAASGKQYRTYREVLADEEAELAAQDEAQRKKIAATLAGESKPKPKRTQSSKPKRSRRSGGVLGRIARAAEELRKEEAGRMAEELIDAIEEARRPVSGYVTRTGKRVGRYLRTYELKYRNRDWFKTEAPTLQDAVAQAKDALDLRADEHHPLRQAKVDGEPVRPGEHYDEPLDAYQPGESVDLHMLAGAPEPIDAYRVPLVLVYDPMDGTEVRRYNVSLLDAWSHDGSPYELLSANFEDYNDAGSAWFEKPGGTIPPDPRPYSERRESFSAEGPSQRTVPASGIERVPVESVRPGDTVLLGGREIPVSFVQTERGRTIIKLQSGAEGIKRRPGQTIRVRRMQEAVRRVPVSGYPARRGGHVTWVDRYHREMKVDVMAALDMMRIEGDTPRLPIKLENELRLSPEDADFLLTTARALKAQLDERRHRRAEEEADAENRGYAGFAAQGAQAPRLQPNDPSQSELARRYGPGGDLRKMREAETQPSSAMVALYPPPEVAQALAQDGGEDAAQLHVTLAFLGKTRGLGKVEDAAAAVKAWARRVPPLEGEISGLGHFMGNPDSGDGQVTYASVDLPELPHNREGLVRAMDRAGFPPRRDHGFTPHMTLAYGHRRPKLTLPMQVRFDRAVLAWNGEHHSFPLTGSVATEAADELLDELLEPVDLIQEATRVSGYFRSRGGRLEHVHSYLRDLANRIGVDPYDVDLSKLWRHAQVCSLSPTSRLPGGSPCFHSKKIDFGVHVLLPAMLHERFPKLAAKLRRTSPRWGHRTGQPERGRQPRIRPLNPVSEAEMLADDVLEEFLRPTQIKSYITRRGRRVTSYVQRRRGAAIARRGFGDATQEDLKRIWARLDLALYRHTGDPHAPEAREIISEQRRVVGEMHHQNLQQPWHGLGSHAHDVVIVGAGPAGLSAAIYGGTEGLDAVLLDANPDPGGQARMSTRIENVLGFPAGITGHQYARMSAEQAERVGAMIRHGAGVQSLHHDPETGIKELRLTDGTTVHAHTVILAGGVNFRRLEHLPPSPTVVYGNSMEMEKVTGNGDPVAIVGAGNSAGQAAVALAAAGRRVTMLVRRSLRGKMSEYLVRQLEASPSIQVREGVEVDTPHLDAQGRLQWLVLKNGEKVPAKAVGLFIGAVPTTAWAQEIARDERGFIEVGREGRQQLETSMPGVFAAGDVRVGSIHRVINAAADGAAAISMVHPYLAAQMKREGARAEENRIQDAYERSLEPHGPRGQGTAALLATLEQMGLTEGDSEAPIRSWLGGRTPADEHFDRMIELDRAQPWSGYAP